MQIYLPVAGCSLNLFLLLGMGGLVGFLSGLFGVGGGFVLTPLLIMIGIPPTVAAASDSNQIVAASASGMLGHYRYGNVDFKMGILLLVGGVGGSSIGVALVKVLRAFGNADFVILICYVAMLGLIGGYMFLESVRELRGTTGAQTEAQDDGPSAWARLIDSLPFQTDFPKSGVRFSVLLPLLLGVIVGILAALMGVGGGFLLIPVMVYLLRMPMHTVLGTSLFQIFFTCVNVTIMQSYMNKTVDIVLALMLLVGSSIGAQLGVKASRRLRGEQIKILLSLIVLVVMLLMLGKLVLPPELLLSYGGE